MFVGLGVLGALDLDVQYGIRFPFHDVPLQRCYYSLF